MEDRANMRLLASDWRTGKYVMVGDEEKLNEGQQCNEGVPLDILEHNHDKQENNEWGSIIWDVDSVVCASGQCHYEPKDSNHNAIWICQEFKFTALKNGVCLSAYPDCLGGAKTGECEGADLTTKPPTAGTCSNFKKR